MNVKGVAYLARQALVVSERGPRDWDEFVSQFRGRHPGLPDPVLPVSRIEVGLFLRFCDDLNDRFYSGKPESYWHFGVASAKTALTQGQLKGLFEKGDAAKYLGFCPQVYRSYFDEGEVTASRIGTSHLELKLTGAPEHYYFEGAIFGFVQGGLEQLEARWPVGEKRPAGKGELIYRYRIAEA